LVRLKNPKTTGLSEKIRSAFLYKVSQSGNRFRHFVCPKRQIVVASSEFNLHSMRPSIDESEHSNFAAFGPRSSLKGYHYSLELKFFTRTYLPEKSTGLLNNRQ